MKKNKTKNKIFAVAVISALLCAMFCITAFAWDSGDTVQPFVEATDINFDFANVDDYTLITITNVNSDMFLEMSNSYNILSGYSLAYYSTVYNSYISCGIFRKSNAYSLTFYDGDRDMNFAQYSSGDWYVSNGGCFYVLTSQLSSVLAALETNGITAEAYVDPIGQIFDNISIGVSGSMTSVGTVASALTSNTLLTIMCIALPIVSIGVGFFVRLKNKA